jgi:hypothetical protein
VNWKTFTEEELKTIRTNPYVKSATSKMIRFTVAFKDEFWLRYHEKGESPRRIMEEMGFDPDVIGKRRIDGIILHLREAVNSGEEFRDVRKIQENHMSEADKKLPPSKAILKMQHKIAYMEQELEFIKKIIKADNEARRK